MTRSCVLIFFISAVIAAGVVYAWWPNLAVALALEDSPVAWLQSSLLVACACAAGFRAMLVPTTEPVNKPRGSLPWVMLSFSLILAALDERFMFHERVQELILFEVLDGNSTFRRLTQMAILVYALVGVGVMLWLRKVMTVPAWRWCGSGIVVGFAAVAMDVAFDSVTLQIFEELLEVVAVTLFLCGLFREAGTQACRRS